MLDAIRAGAELDEIGAAAGVTRERIRQIVRDTAARTNNEPRDLLADVLAVCGDTETRVRLSEIRRRLCGLVPDHPPYWAGMGLVGTKIGEQLAKSSVRVVRCNGRPIKLDVTSLRTVVSQAR